MTDDYKIKVFIGAYVNPSCGEWVDLLSTDDDELDEFVKRIQEKSRGEEVGVFDASDEEELLEILGESLSWWIEFSRAFEELEEPGRYELYCALDAGILDKYSLIRDGKICDLQKLCDSISVYTDVKTDEDLGRYYLEELMALEVPDELKDYIDYESYGKDVRTDSIGNFSRKYDCFVEFQ